MQITNLLGLSVCFVRAWFESYECICTYESCERFTHARMSLVLEEYFCNKQVLWILQPCQSSSNNLKSKQFVFHCYNVLIVAHFGCQSLKNKLCRCFEPEKCLSIYQHRSCFLNVMVSKPLKCVVIWLQFKVCHLKQHNNDSPTPTVNFIFPHLQWSQIWLFSK